MTMIARIAIPKGTAHPCYQLLTVSSSTYDMRLVSAATVKLVSGRAVVKTWSFTPDAATTEGQFVGRHDFIEADTDTEGTFSLVISLAADGGSIPVKCADRIRVFDPLKEQP